MGVHAVPVPDAEPTRRNTDTPPPAGEARARSAEHGGEGAQNESNGRYRPLVAGAHGLAGDEVERDQRTRLKLALVELIAERGYQAVRIRDLAALAHVSQPTFYKLYTDKDALLLSAYDEIVWRSAGRLLAADEAEGPLLHRVQLALDAFAELVEAEPDAMSLFLFGAYGAGANVLEHRNRTLEMFERRIESIRSGVSPPPPGEQLTVKVILGGIREVAAARLRARREDELAELAGELTAWVASYPPRLPAKLGRPVPWLQAPASEVSERARRAEGRLPSGRHDLGREVVEKTQRERIVDATAAIVAEKGLARLTIPDICSRAQVSHATFYEMYPTKRDAFLGAQKVGMHQAFQLSLAAYEEHGSEDWSMGVAEGLRALIAYLRAEPAHAHLSIVDTFAASPETLEVRDETLRAFAAYLGPDERRAVDRTEVPAIAAEAVVGGLWQILYYYVSNRRFVELVEDTPLLIFLALVPFIGTAAATRAALHSAQP